MKILKLSFFILTVSIIFCSCDNNKIDKTYSNDNVANDTVDNNLIFYDIENKELLKEIEMYIDSAYSYSYVKNYYSKYPSNVRVDSIDYINIRKRVIMINVYLSKDTTTYQLYYSLNNYCFLDVPILFSKIKDNIVAFHYCTERVLERDYKSDIKLPENIVWKYIKDYYPEEYEYYLYNVVNFPLTNRRTMLSPRVGRTVEWTLIFKYGKLIEKIEVIYG